MISTEEVVRNKEMVKLFRSGRTMNDLAQRYGISRQRVQQILSRNGIGARQGGRFVAMRKRAS